MFIDPNSQSWGSKAMLPYLDQTEGRPDQAIGESKHGEIVTTSLKCAVGVCVRRERKREKGVFVDTTRDTTCMRGSFHVEPGTNSTWRKIFEVLLQRPSTRTNTDNSLLSASIGHHNSTQKKETDTPTSSAFARHRGKRQKQRSKSLEVVVLSLLALSHSQRAS